MFQKWQLDAHLTGEMNVMEHLGRDAICFASSRPRSYPRLRVGGSAACVLSLIRFKLMVAIYPDLTDVALFFSGIFLTLETAEMDWEEKAGRT